MGGAMHGIDLSRNHWNSKLVLAAGAAAAAAAGLQPGASGRGLYLMNCIFSS
jgi:hypothetical protein